MTESISEERIVITAEPSPSRGKIADRKTIVYETLVDQTVIKLRGERLKTGMFATFFFIAPPAEEIQLVSVSKFYEPFMILSGKYAIDYYRKSAYTIKLDKEAHEVQLLGQQFKPEQPKETTYGEKQNILKLEGEERITKEYKASLVLDQSGRDFAPERLPSAPSERNPQKILAESGTQEIPEDADLNIIRARILKRPNDVNRVVTELFEVNERVVIYAPRYKLTYKDTVTGKEKAIIIDGVTAKRIYTRP